MEFPISSPIFPNGNAHAKLNLDPGVSGWIGIASGFHLVQAFSQHVEPFVSKMAWILFFDIRRAP